jgi:maleylpyruvate isomerase
MPMYASADQRAADIKAGADRSWPDLVADLAEAGDRLWAAMVAMQRDAWAARVQTAQGRDVPAATVVWMRVREVWIHAVDLGAGTDYTDFPGSLVDALLDDVTAAFTTRGTAPAVRLAPTDRRRVWTVGAGAGADPSAGTVAGDGEQVSAPAARIAAWLTGRDRLDGAPDLPPWL